MTRSKLIVITGILLVVALVPFAAAWYIDDKPKAPAPLALTLITPEYCQKTCDVMRSKLELMKTIYSEIKISEVSPKRHTPLAMLLQSSKRLIPPVIVVSVKGRGVAYIRGNAPFAVLERVLQTLMLFKTKTSPNKTQ